jgi:hypothetical protein
LVCVATDSLPQGGIDRDLSKINKTFSRDPRNIQFLEYVAVVHPSMFSMEVNECLTCRGFNEPGYHGGSPWMRG